jgi:hypothetical protein
MIQSRALDTILHTSYVSLRATRMTGFKLAIPAKTKTDRNTL